MRRKRMDCRMIDFCLACALRGLSSRQYYRLWFTWVDQCEGRI